MSKRVGRGLASLIPESALDDSPATTETSVPGDGAIKVPLSELQRNPHQPREVFDDEELAQLTESIRIHGVLSPLVVRKEDGKYILIAGERRMRAAGKAGLTEVPVVVREAAEDRVQLELALVENLQRSDLDPIEAARGFQKLNQEYGYTQGEIATAVGKKRETITNLIGLLKLPDFVLDSVRNGKITVGHAKAMRKLQDDDAKLKEVLRQIDDRGLNVRQVESLIAAMENPEPSKGGKGKPRDNRMAYAERLLEDALQTTVSIATKNQGGGKITIEYTDDEHLEHLLEVLQQQNEG